MDTNRHPVTEAFRLLSGDKLNTAQMQTIARDLTPSQQVTTLAMLADFNKSSLWVTAGNHKKASTFYATESTKHLNPYKDLRDGRFEDNYKFIREIPDMVQKLETLYDQILNSPISPDRDRSMRKAGQDMIDAAPVEIVHGLQHEIAKEWGLDVEKYKKPEPLEQQDLREVFLQLFLDRTISLQEQRKAQEKMTPNLVCI